MTRHHAEILKGVVKEEYQNLERWQKIVIGNDQDHLTRSFDWFATLVKNRAQAIYEDPNRWENQRYIDFCQESSQKYHYGQ